MYSAKLILGKKSSLYVLNFSEVLFWKISRTNNSKVTFIKDKIITLIIMGVYEEEAEEDMECPDPH